MGGLLWIFGIAFDIVADNSEIPTPVLTVDHKFTGFHLEQFHLLPCSVPGSIDVGSFVGLADEVPAVVGLDAPNDMAILLESLKLELLPWAWFLAFEGDQSVIVVGFEPHTRLLVVQGEPFGNS